MNQVDENQVIADNTPDPFKAVEISTLLATMQEFKRIAKEELFKVEVKLRGFEKPTYANVYYKQASFGESIRISNILSSLFDASAVKDARRGELDETAVDALDGVLYDEKGNLLSRADVEALVAIMDVTSFMILAHKVSNVEELEGKLAKPKDSLSKSQ